LPTSAEVVVIGGGAVGVSAAWHLRELGIEDVLLVERDSLGSGSTAKSAGGVRMQFADELNVQIALRSLAELERMDGIDLRQVGYLFLLDRADDVAEFRAALTLQGRFGVPSRELSVAEALELVPQLGAEELLAATFCPLDGHCTPEAVVQWYAHGLRVLQGCEVTGIEIRAGQVTGVVTTRGRIATGTVICCAGAWAAEIGALAGVEIPVRGEPRWMWFTPEAGGLPDPMPMTIDFSTGLYVHREGPGLVFGGREASLEALAPAIERRLPLLADLPVQASWWGYYEVSPDHNAIVGELAGPRRFLVATGFSGHGFQQAPAVGEHLAELVAGVTPTLDLSPFALERFAGGTERAERFVV
jgi:sarcosine oxidase subunit beta